MGPKREHHTLPRLYLKGFAESEAKPFIWAYTKGRPFKKGSGSLLKYNPARLPISKASVIPYAYSYTRSDGTFDPDTFENELERLEKPSDPIIRKIRSKVMISQEEKEIFTSYVLLMRRRVPSSDEKAKADWEKLLKSWPVLEAIRSQEAYFRLTEEKRREVEEVLSRYEKPVKELLLKGMTTDLETVSLLLRKMRWRFLMATGPSRFITGDQPVAYTGLGLLKIPAELTFPLSTDIALHASWQPGQERFLDINERAVRLINYRTATNSEKLFANSGEEWIVKILNRGDYPIRLIDVSGTLSMLWRYRHQDIPEEWLA